MSTINLTAPQNYKEMTAKQIRYVAALQLNAMEEKDIWRKCLIKFCNLVPIGGTNSIYFFRKKGEKKSFSLTLDEMNFFVKKMKYVTTKYIGCKPVQIGRYLPCDQLLRDTKFVQYLDAENYYQQYIFTKSDTALFKLMATLYQDSRLYSHKTTENRAIYFKRHASEVEKMVVLMWMVGVKEYFVLKFPELFQSNKVNDDDEPVMPPDMYSIIQNQVRMLTEGDITKETQVLSAQTWSALGEMNAKIREAKELEKQTKNV